MLLTLLLTLTGTTLSNPTVVEKAPKEARHVNGSVLNRDVRIAAPCRVEEGVGVVKP